MFYPAAVAWWSFPICFSASFAKPYLKGCMKHMLSVKYIESNSINFWKVFNWIKVKLSKRSWSGDRKRRGGRKEGRRSRRGLMRWLHWLKRKRQRTRSRRKKWRRAVRCRVWIARSWRWRRIRRNEKKKRSKSLKNQWTKSSSKVEFQSSMKVEVAIQLLDHRGHLLLLVSPPWTVSQLAQ